MGAEFSHGTSRDTASVSLRTMTEPAFLQSALKTFADAISHPAFPAEGFKRQQQQTLNALKAQQQSPAKIAMETFF